MELTETKYKQTEVGVIPEDWEVIEFGKLGQFLKGKGIKKDEVKKSGFPCVRYGELYTVYDNIIRQTKSFIDADSANSSFKLKYGDLLFAGSGETKEEIGKSAIILRDDSYGGGDIVILRTNGVDFEYMGYISNSESIAKQKALYGQGDAVVHIYSSGISKVKIPLPPTRTEQKAIATVLSDTDALIQALEKKIAKKKLIKKGVMQRLLNPYVMVDGELLMVNGEPALKEGWEVKTIKELANYRRGSFPQPYGLPEWYDNISGMPFIQVVDVGDNFRLKKETKQKISKAGAEKSVFVKKGTIILTIQGSIGRICITEYDAYVDRTLLIFESFKETFNDYFFMLSVWLKFQIEKENAPGGIIKTITKEALSSFEIAYPNLEEQTRIAQILSDLDQEIEALEQKLHKYQVAKQGMMQQLLTGRVRLIV